jgi:intracellular sulfur oxidation DsrE/DsrF family protein
MKRVFAFLLGLSLTALAHAADPDLVIAGRGASLEQAVAAPHAPNYRLLVLRKEVQRVRASRAEEEVRALLVRARTEGAVVFVCERELRKQHLQPADLLPGIVTVDGSDVWVSGEPSQADLKLKSICS